jgi:uncharacterized RDD family membrane protein YckC
MPLLRFMPSFLLLAGLVWSGRGALAANVTPHDLIALGENQDFLLARIEQTAGMPSSVHTTIYFRQFGEDDKWQALPVIPGRVVALASQGSQPAALLDDGTWLLLHADSAAFTAGPLPMPARMVALAGSSHAWWAVGAVPGGVATLVAATQPATQESIATTTIATGPEPVAATRPATHPATTQPAANQLVLFCLEGNDWTVRGELPEVVSVAPSVALGFVDDLPYLATADPGGTLRIRHLEQGQWIVDDTLTDLSQLAAFQWLSTSSTPRLWVEHQTGPDRVYTFGKKGTSSIALPVIADSDPKSRAVTVAFGRMRMIAAVKDKLIEQDFSPQNGQPEGKPFELSLPQTSSLVDFQRMQSVVVTVALILAMLGSLRQRSTAAAQAETLRKLVLAPYGRRLIAGLIDAAPVIIAIVGATIRFHNSKMPDQTQSLLFMVVYWCAGIFYVVYTTIIEVLLGRSLGKVLMGLRVVGLDGLAAKPMALVTRNVLRLIEVGLGFLPLVMILLFPLRQRAGDVGAGTLVVTDGQAEDAQE